MDIKIYYANENAGIDSERLCRQGVRQTPYSIEELETTHTYIGEIRNLDDENWLHIFEMMQVDRNDWPPDPEMMKSIAAMENPHSSMSPGDIVVFRGQAMEVLFVGWRFIEKGEKQNGK